MRRKPVVLIMLIIICFVLSTATGCISVTKASTDSVYAEDYVKATVQENQAEKSDNEAPVIYAPENIFTSVGAVVRYKSYITVTDNLDKNPDIDIDNSDVNVAVPGKYSVKYTATDSSGNTCTKYVDITVNDQTEPAISDEEIYAKADEILNQITDDDMSDLEKVFAVFYYIRENFPYAPDQKHWSYKQEAYEFMKNMRGSCYGNVSLSKLLLERLGYDAIIVEGSMAIDEERHYWNLVSIDNGENWYIFDAIWVMSYDEPPICMITKDFIEAIAYRNNMEYKCNWTAYPPVSKDPLWTITDYNEGKVPDNPYYPKR